MGLLNRFRSSLSYPIAVTAVAVTVVPVVIVGWLLASHNREHLTTLEKQYLTRQAVSLASEVSLYFSSHRTQLVSTARALGDARTLEPASAQELLREMAGDRPTFLLLGIIDRTGEASVVQPRAASPATTEALLEILRRVHEQTMQGEQVENLHAALPGSPAGGAVFGFPLLAGRDAPIGTLVGVLDLEPLQDRLSDNAYAGLLVSIINRDGEVVVSSQPNLRSRSLKDSPLVRDFLANRARLTLTYRQPVDLEAGEVLGSVAPVEGLGWGVVAERPTAEAYASVRFMQQRTAVVTAVAALLALAIAFIMSRRLVGPLQKLAGVTSELAEGNLAVRAEVPGANEIARLAGDFNDMAGSIEALVRRLRQALRQNQELFLETIRTLAAAIDAKDPYTRGHSERVSSYSMAIAKHLGLGQDEVFRVRISSILHDVGKLGIRDNILNKPGQLTDHEFEIMRRHPDIGAQIMSPIRMLKDIIPGIRNHHETWDGKGYPDGLSGEGIPLVARIIGVADTFDAMTTNRPYQKAMSLDFVTAKMRELAGKKFDPVVVDSLLQAVAAGDITPPIYDNSQQTVASGEVS